MTSTALGLEGGVASRTTAGVGGGMTVAVDGVLAGFSTIGVGGFSAGGGVLSFDFGGVALISDGFSPSGATGSELCCGGGSAVFF